ncbi:unnamed protein product [Parascedosporium putredinis]|uniref:S-adenosyl-L-methionine-dependent methyltransferase n=1 Tax=Parascedosporium putredinis TaxID=1442378 RepID=A0A9P1MBX6_9PEZI|nr:unnamed protein product [Parascedosporium putredinis]CAI8000520.1 unnamed protein product [Parascedosporium putredinis]
MVSFKVPVFFLALAAQALGQGQNGDVTCSTRYSTKSVKTVTTKTSTRYTTVTHTERVPKIQTITPAQSTTITSTFYETADGGTITVVSTELSTVTTTSTSTSTVPTPAGFTPVVPMPDNGASPLIRARRHEQSKPAVHRRDASTLQVNSGDRQFIRPPFQVAVNCLSVVTRTVTKTVYTTTPYTTTAPQQTKTTTAVITSSTTVTKYPSGGSSSTVTVIVSTTLTTTETHTTTSTTTIPVSYTTVVPAARPVYEACNARNIYGGSGLRYPDRFSFSDINFDGSEGYTPYECCVRCQEAGPSCVGTLYVSGAALKPRERYRLRLLENAMTSNTGIGNDRFNAEATAWDSNPFVHEMSLEAWKAIQRYLPSLFSDSASRKPDVLEVGCGTGLLSLEVAPSANRLVAVDSAGDDREVLLEDPEDKRLPPIDLADPDGPRLKYDLITSHLVLHHITDLQSVLKTMFGCLKKGGVVALTDFEDFGPEARKFHPESKMEGVERHGIPRDWMASLMEEAGFTNVRVEVAWDHVKIVEARPGEFQGGIPSAGQGELMKFTYLICLGEKP